MAVATVVVVSGAAVTGVAVTGVVVTVLAECEGTRLEDSILASKQEEV
jgi:hypothetical protein